MKIVVLNNVNENVRSVYIFVICISKYFFPDLRDSFMILHNVVNPCKFNGIAYI